MPKNSSKLPPFTQVPGYMFFLGHFKIPIDITPEYLKFFKFKKSSGAAKTQSIKLRIKGKDYEADIRKSSPKKSSETILFRYNKKPETLKALRKFMISSYAKTISKSKSKSKEHIKFTYIGNDTFELKAINHKKSEFDEMFHFLEDKNLFAYWQAEKVKKKSKKGMKKPKNRLFLRPSLKWIPKKDIKLPEYKRRKDVIYLLNHSKTNQLYVGKANDFGNRVKEKSSRSGLKTFDRFLLFELHPEYSFLLDNIETFSIKLLATLFINDFRDVKGLDLKEMSLVNRQMKGQSLGKY